MLREKSWAALPKHFRAERRPQRGKRTCAKKYCFKNRRNSLCADVSFSRSHSCLWVDSYLLLFKKGADVCYVSVCYCFFHSFCTFFSKTPCIFPKTKHSNQHRTQSPPAADSCSCARFAVTDCSFLNFLMRTHYSTSLLSFMAITRSTGYLQLL